MGHLDRHMLSVHSEKAFETVEKVYQASQSAEAPQPEKQQGGGGGCRGKAPQFASLVQVEGGQQHLLIDQQNPMALARRPSTDFLPLVGCEKYPVPDLHFPFFPL